MLIEELVSYYQKTAAKAVSAVPKASILGGTADEILEMVTCYASDAAVFLKHGDLVNAFAASEYGLGWLDCGVYLGYVNAEISNCLALEKEFPTDLFEKLEEKTLRYERMLNGALAGSVPAPDAEAGCYAAVEKIRETAERALSVGEGMLPEDYVNALAVFSYGYGWLDCGVRSGLFQITGDRHLFTI